MKRLALAVILGLAGAATAQPVARPVAAAAFQLNGEAVQGGRMIGTAPAGTVALHFGDQLVAVDADGRFLIAFDRDAAPSASLTARLADGRVVSQSLAVAPRAWRPESSPEAAGHLGTRRKNDTSWPST